MPIDLARKRRIAQAAADGPNGEWDLDYSAQDCCGYVTVDPTDISAVSEDLPALEHIADNDPRSVLEMCRWIERAVMILHPLRLSSPTANKLIAEVTDD